MTNGNPNTRRTVTEVGGGIAGLHRFSSPSSVAGLAMYNQVTTGANISTSSANTLVRTNQLARGTRFLAKKAPLVNGAIAAYDISNAYRLDGGTIGNNTIVTTSSSLGSIAGGWAGAKGGAAAGAAVGVWFGGIGAVPGAIIGGIVGGVVGSLVGSELGERAGEQIIN